MGVQPVYYQDIGDSYEIAGELQDMIRIEALPVAPGRYINDLDIENSRKSPSWENERQKCSSEKKTALENTSGSKGGIQGGWDFPTCRSKPWTESDLEAIVIPLTAMYRTFGTGERVDYFVCSAAPNVLVRTPR